MTESVPVPWRVMQADWPPTARIKGPVSPSLYERITTCPLQCSFQGEGRFPRRSGPVARIGTAFHRAMQQLDALSNAASSPRDLAVGLLHAFEGELMRERERSLENYRERGIEWPTERIDAASNSLILLAHRVFADRTAIRGNSSTRPPAAEVEVGSSDNLIKGIIDRVERSSAGTVIIDFKTSTSEQSEVSDRYRRQVRIYAYLWFERFGYWPIGGIISYPLLRKEVPLEIVPEDCLQLADDFRAALAEVIDRDPIVLGRPGEACRHCDFRPWCQPFWKKREAVVNLDEALLEARVGLEGTVAAVTDSLTHRQISLFWNHRRVELSVDRERWEHIGDLEVGMRLRILDCHLRGDMSHPTCELSSRSEIWLVEPEWQ